MIYSTSSYNQNQNKTLINNHGHLKLLSYVLFFKLISCFFLYLAIYQSNNSSNYSIRKLYNTNSGQIMLSILNMYIILIFVSLLAVYKKADQRMSQFLLIDDQISLYFKKIFESSVKKPNNLTVLFQSDNEQNLLIAKDSEQNVNNPEQNVNIYINTASLEKPEDIHSIIETNKEHINKFIEDNVYEKIILYTN